MYCYNGKVLRVDLSNKKWYVENLRRDWVEKYVGGRGLGFRYLYEEVPTKVNPLFPGNVLIVATGPLTGTIAPLSGRYPIITKSPQSYTILDSYGGDLFGVKLKFVGYDMLIIQGRASEPCYIHISEDGVELKDARGYRGMGARKAAKMLKEEVGDSRASVLAIGPAGENLVRYASIVGDGEWIHGRGGGGAVMGSKNLKAVVVNGFKGSVNLHDLEKFREVVRDLIKNSVMTDANLWASSDGTPITVTWSQHAGILVTRDYTSGIFEGWEGICTERIRESLDSRYSCYSCPLVCKRRIKVDGKEVKAPEYEALAMLGSNTGTDKLKDVAEMNELADDLGMDSISLGSILGLMIHLYKDGLIDKEELKGLKLEWGDADSLSELIRMIAYRKGIGDLLAEGSKNVASRIKGAEKYVMEVKGVEIAGYDPRGSWGMALSYATSDRGACHHRPWMVGFDAFGPMDQFSFEGKAELAKKFQDLLSIKWSLILCEFWVMGYKEIRDLLGPAMNKDYDERELELIGERIWNLAKMFNVREGFGKEHDFPSQRAFSEPLKGGKSDGKVLPREEFDRALTEYYVLREWDPETGNPLSETLERLGLSEDLSL